MRNCFWFPIWPIRKREEKYSLVLLLLKLVFPSLKVFDSLVRWTEHDRKERGIHFTRLLQLVRLPLLPTSALMEHIETAELVQRSPSAKEMVMEAMRFNAFSESQKISLPQNPRTVPRTCSTLVDVILFVGGKGRSVEEGRVTFCYEPVGDRWYTLASLQWVW